MCPAHTRVPMSTFRAHLILNNSRWDNDLKPSDSEMILRRLNSPLLPYKNTSAVSNDSWLPSCPCLLRSVIPMLLHRYSIESFTWNIFLRFHFFQF